MDEVLRIQPDYQASLGRSYTKRHITLRRPTALGVHETHQLRSCVWISGTYHNQAVHLTWTSSIWDEHDLQLPPVLRLVETARSVEQLPRALCACLESVTANTLALFAEVWKSLESTWMRLLLTILNIYWL